MRVGVPKETETYERRVAMVPDVATRLLKQGHEVTIESGAGEAAWFDDDAYRAKDVAVAAEAGSALAGVDLVCKVQPPTETEVALIPEGGAVVSFLQPGSQLDLVRRLAEAQITASAAATSAVIIWRWRVRNSADCSLA